MAVETGLLAGKPLLVRRLIGRRSTVTHALFGSLGQPLLALLALANAPQVDHVAHCYPPL